jgi:hypothetical protein
MNTLLRGFFSCGRIPVEECQKLIERMPRRVQALVTAKGGYTKYNIYQIPLVLQKSKTVTKVFLF